MSKLTSIRSLLREHPADIELLQQCVVKYHYYFRKSELAQAWNRLSADNLIKSAKENPTKKSIEEFESALQTAWDPIPTHADAQLFNQLKPLLIFKPKKILSIKIGKFLSFNSRNLYYWIYFVSFFLAGIFFAWASQFLIYDEAIKRFASRLSSPIVGNFRYPSEGEVSSKPKITVFAIDDNDLSFYKKTYPLPYSFHARMLDSLDALSPKAVFLDVWFHDQRDDPSINSLVESICRLHKHGTRVYLAQIPAQKRGENDLRNELTEISVKGTEPSSLAKKFGACATEVSVGKNVDDLDRQSWRYDLVANDGDEKLFSAAAQIYNDLPGHQPLTSSATPLALVWGVNGASINQNPYGSDNSYKTECRNTWYKSEAIPLPKPIKQIFPEWIFPLTETAKPFCNYHAMLPFSALAKIPGEDLAPLVSDRVIIYGGNLQSLDDSLYSPVHGRIAGLNLHAMALDNLMHYGDQYPKAEEFDLTKPTSDGTLFPLVVVLFFSGLATFAQWCRNTQSVKLFMISACFRRFTYYRLPSIFKKTNTVNHACVISYLFNELISGLSGLLKWLLSWFVRIAIALAMVLFMARIGLEWFHLGPLSWMEYAISPIAMEFLNVGAKVADRIHNLCLKTKLNT